ncbi:hypothetical protein CRI94_00230 [Longibacter salinarum]|uniref:Uncharacterized protein n=1 Tax=Longibacter salinarum TaxID=1850348 RepID=A0A2A8D1K4_9BACT|nr:hypothetical protein CRI94_00230 [Longibacter salinarum]
MQKSRNEYALRVNLLLIFRSSIPETTRSHVGKYAFLADPGGNVDWLWITFLAWGKTVDNRQ